MKDHHNPLKMHPLVLELSDKAIKHYHKFLEDEVKFFIDNKKIKSWDLMTILSSLFMSHYARHIEYLFDSTDNMSRNEIFYVLDLALDETKGRLREELIKAKDRKGKNERC